MRRPQPDFDGIARAYRWLEYATLGPLLERMRFRFVPRMLKAKRALVLGDGDGRFTARLLAADDDVRVDAVDLSGRMLALLRRRCVFAAARLNAHQTDALEFVPAADVDLVVTHFFLDCLEQAQVEALVARIAGEIRPKALWIVSEFAVPTGAMEWPARALVRGLYFCFRVLTGLRPTRLPDHGRALRGAGFVCDEADEAMFGVLRAEVWRRG